MNTSDVPAVALPFDTGGVISLLVGFVLPNLVGILTTRSMNPGLKAALLAAAAGVSGVLSQWLQAINSDVPFQWETAVVTAFVTWVTAELAYFKIWKPSGVAEALKSRGVTDGTDPIDITTDMDSAEYQGRADTSKMFDNPEVTSDDTPDTPDDTPEPLSEKDSQEVTDDSSTDLSTRPHPSPS